VGQLEVRHALHRTLMLEGELGGGALGLFARPADPAYWFPEVVVGGRVIWAAPQAAALWLRAQLSLPVAAPANAQYSPSSALTLELGSSLSYIRDWDIYVQLGALSRGDVALPRSMLP